MNCAGAERGSNTPDFILGEFHAGVQRVLDELVGQRDRWYGVELGPGHRRVSVDAAIEAVFQAIGEASTCWEHPEGAGRFLDERAGVIGWRLLELLGYPVPEEHQKSADVMVGVASPADRP